MSQKFNEPVSVILYSSHQTRHVVPKKIFRNGQVYDIKKIGLHHTVKVGDVLYHIFSVATENFFMELEFNTQNLHWNLRNLKDYND